MKEGLVLYPHQAEGIRRILTGLCQAIAPKCSLDKGRPYPLRSFLLYDDMGLGKTIQALEALKRMMASDLLRLYDTPVLIIAPASCLHIWQQEIAKWFSNVFTDVRL